MDVAHVGSAKEADAAPRFPDRGSAIGRYIILDRLGAGGMGVVYGAYDPELDRRVAIKLVRPDGVEAGGERRARLLREAQALARLSHPNVVAIHDVGEHDGAVWVAMELVEGRTFDEVLHSEQAGWSERLRLLLAAGSGVAAAHASGLVHRDLKPQNVMLGSDGRVRVMDFGLATAVGDRAGAVDAAEGNRALDERLTSAGAILGTPAYMAPEQWAGGKTDERTDQFSFGVLAWEMLFGERPFQAATIVELAAAVLDGELRLPAGAPHHPPTWVRRVLERGLARNPELRWPSMNALLTELARGRARRRLRVGAASAATLALASIAAWGVAMVDEQGRLEACERDGANIAAVWNDDARARLTAALTSTGLAAATSTLEKLLPVVDEAAATWADTRSSTCVRYGAGGDDERLRRADWCLDVERARLEALLDAAESSPRTTLPQAVPLAMGLAAAECEREQHLDALEVPPPEIHDDARHLFAEAQEIETLVQTAQRERALELSAHLDEQARAFDWSPLNATVAFERGRALQFAGDLAAAHTAFREAYFAGRRSSGGRAVAAASAVRLVGLLGADLGRFDEGQLWAELAAAELELDAGATTSARALLANERAKLQAVRGNTEAARALFEEAVLLWSEERGPEHPDVATALLNVAGTRIREAQGLDRARAEIERALDIQVGLLGQDHPDVARSLGVLAGLELLEGRSEEARSLYERALAVQERVLGPDAPEVGYSLSSIASAKSTSDPATARAAMERGAAILERTYGRDHPDTLWALRKLADMDVAANDLPRARATYEDILERLEASGENLDDVARTQYSLAETHRKAGDFARATELLERSVAGLAASAGNDDPRLAIPLAALVENAVAAERHSLARTAAARLVAIDVSGAPVPLRLARAQGLLTAAKAFAAVDRIEARALVLAAKSAFAEPGEVGDQGEREAEALVRALGGDP